MMCECISCSRIRPTTPVWEDSPQSSHHHVVALCCCIQRQLSWTQFHSHGSSSMPKLLMPRVTISHHHTNTNKKTRRKQSFFPIGINFYGPYLSAPTLALTILFANSGLHFLHFSSVPRFSIYHYAFDGLALLLLLVPSTCAAIGHWLKFIFWFYVFDATSFCVNLPGMYNPFE